MRTLILSLFALVAWAAPSQAHPNLQNRMLMVFEPSTVRVTVGVSLKELGIAYDISVSDDEPSDPAAIKDAAERHRDYLPAHLTLSSGTTPLTGKVTEIDSPTEFGDPEGTYFFYELKYAVSAPLPTEVSISHDMLKEWGYAVGADWTVSYVLGIKSAGSTNLWYRLLNARQPLVIPTDWSATPAAAEVAKTQGWRTFKDYLWHGVMHILTGYDHLLFVAALVIVTLSVWEMLKVIAAFTLAHTLTLALSVFDLFRLPASIVEPVIALSIVFVAVENLLRPQRAHSRLRLVVAFGFGLVHGLGFAGGLLNAMAGLPSIGIWIALAAFSLGVEIGHQVVVLPLFGLLAFGRRKLRDTFRASLLRYGSATIACCGAYYLVVALHGQSLS